MIWYKKLFKKGYVVAEATPCCASCKYFKDKCKKFKDKVLDDPYFQICSSHKYSDDYKIYS